MSDQSLYERLGGVFAIAAVVDHFSDAVVRNPIVGQQSQNPALREWHTQNLGRLPGLKFMRTLWVCNVAGGPFEYTATLRQLVHLPDQTAVTSQSVVYSTSNAWRRGSSLAWNALVAIAERFQLPINAIGIGEGLDDLEPFDAQDFARAIAGAKSENEAAA